MTAITVSIRREVEDHEDFPTWDMACGRAVLAAISGAMTVVVTGTNGVQYTLAAWSKEDNS